MVPEKQQHLSPRSSENKDRGDDKNHKRERTRSKSRDRRSKSSRSGGSRRDRSRSRDRRRRDRSRGRDRSRERHRSGGGRDSSSRGSGGKSHRSRSPTNKATDGSKSVVGDQQASIRPWVCQYENVQQQMAADNHQSTSTMNTGGGPPGSMFTQFRTPPQPPIIPTITPNSYQQQQLQKPSNSKWTAMGGDERNQQPYVPDNNFRTNTYGGDSDDEDDRETEFDNTFHKRFNDKSSTPAMRRFPGQDFRDQQGFGPNRGPRFNKPPQAVGIQNNRGGGHRQSNDFGGVSGPRFNNHQQPTRYGGGNQGNSEGGAVRQSRFSSIQESGRPSRFNSMPQSRDNEVDNSNFDDESKRLPPRYNDRYRYDVRNTQPPTQSEGLCVEVNNMSNHFSYGDIRKLFEGIHIDGSAIKIQKHRQGVAFVRFDNNNNKNLALQVNGTEYKSSCIVVKHLDDEAYERENTDDRPYPSAVAVPTIVDHVDLVDDDDDDDEQPVTEDNKQKDKQDNDNHSDDDCNLVVCEKNVKDGGKADGGGSDEQSSTITTTSQQQQEQPTKYLKLKQLPITVTEEDVLNEIDGGGDVRRVTIYPDGEFLGAALEFQSVDAAEAALKRFDCVLLGSTPVPVLRCSYNEYTLIKRKTGGGSRRFTASDTGSRHHHHHHNQHHPPSSSRSPPAAPLIQAPPPPSLLPGLRSNCVYVYGLPTTVTNTDITQFFNDTSTLPDKIHIMLSKFGRPTGESYCEFSTPQQAHAALAKDQCYMGPNMVYVELIGRSDMIQAITKPMQPHNNHQDLSWGGGGMRGGGGGPRVPQHNILSTPRNHQGPQPPSQQSSFGGHNGPYGNRPHHQYMNNNGGGRGGGYTPRIRGPGPGPNTGPDGFGQPGCVVALDNVPYRADVQEIVDFFEGFELNSQNVIRRFNDFGKPTGEARVNLRNPQEAMRAVRVLQNKPIYNRPVRLTLL